MEGDGPDLAEILDADACLSRPTSAHDAVAQSLRGHAGADGSAIVSGGRIVWTAADSVGLIRQWVFAYTGRDLGTLATWIRFFDPTTEAGLVAVISAPRPGNEAELVVLANPGVLTRSTLRALSRWAFSIIGLCRLVVRVPTDRPDLQDFARRAGFRFEGIARCGLGPSQNAQTWAMVAQDCRWLPRFVSAIPEHDTSSPASLQVH